LVFQFNMDDVMNDGWIEGWMMDDHSSCDHVIMCGCMHACMHAFCIITFHVDYCIRQIKIHVTSMKSHACHACHACSSWDHVMKMHFASSHFMWIIAFAGPRSHAELRFTWWWWCCMASCIITIITSHLQRWVAVRFIIQYFQSIPYFLNFHYIYTRVIFGTKDLIVLTNLRNES
jgi:hypothetical protein